MSRAKGFVEPGRIFLGSQRDVTLSVSTTVIHDLGGGREKRRCSLKICAFGRAGVTSPPSLSLFISLEKHPSHGGTPKMKKTRTAFRVMRVMELVGR